MTRILITGVSGKAGAPLAELVADRDDLEVLGGSSDPSTVTIDGVGPTALSWDDQQNRHSAGFVLSGA